MKTELTAHRAYLPPRSTLSKEGSKKLLPGAILPAASAVSESADFKLDLSGKGPLTPTPPSVPIPSLPELPKLDFSQSQESVREPVKEEIKKKVEEVREVQIKNGSQKRPAVLFIKGLDVFSSPLKSEGGYAGMERIAQGIEGSKVFGWDQKEEIMNEIRMIHRDYPLVLVGHSLGGDTAIEIAEELDSLDEKFRKVDLLVTVDAIGLSHDVISQNVKKHLNVFGETSFLLKDGPHVARREEFTTVRNILSPLDHTEIDDNKEVQFEVVTAIQEVLGQMKDAQQRF